MEFEVWKDIVSQRSYFKSRSDPVSLGGGGRNLGKTLKVEKSG